MKQADDDRVRVASGQGRAGRAVCGLALAWLAGPSVALADVRVTLSADGRNQGSEPNLVQVEETRPATVYGNARASFSAGGSEAFAGPFETQGEPWPLGCCASEGGFDATASGAVDGPTGWLRVGARADLPAGAVGSSIATARAAILDQLTFAGSDVSFEVDLDFDFQNDGGIAREVELYVGLGGSELLSISANHATDKWRVRFQGEFLELDVPVPPSYRHTFTFTPTAGPVSAVVSLDSRASCAGQPQACHAVADATGTAYLGITGEFSSTNGYLYLGPVDGSGPRDPVSEAATGLLVLGGVAAAMARQGAWRRRRGLPSSRVSRAVEAG